MGLITFIKERLSYLVVGLITIAIVAFIISDVVRNGTPFFRESQNQIGTVGGTKISYDDFSDKLKDKEDQFKAQYRQTSLPEQTKHFINEQAWNELVSKIILDQEISKTGVEVTRSSAEEVNMVTGQKPDPQIQQAFTDPQTGVFDRSRVLSFLKSMDKDPTGDTRKRWDKFETELLESHSIQKYLQLIRSGMYLTNLELKESVNVPEKANIQYLMMDYNRIPDNKVNISESDLKQYYKDHSYLYKVNEEQRSFDYVVFTAKPTKEDTAFALKDINRLAEDFKKSTRDSDFVSLNSDSKIPFSYVKRSKLPKNLDSNLVNKPEGTVYGPYFENGAYKIAKLISVKDIPDSVKCRHILLSDAAQGAAPSNYPALLKKADSLKSVILKGGNFANLAVQYSADKGSAIKGGELGFAAIGTYVKPFENAIFFGKTGEYKIVQSQFGVHLIQIEDQKNIAKAYEIGIVDKAFHPSNKTVQDNYAQATKFLSGLGNQDFASYARKQGLVVRSAQDTKANDPQVNNLDNSRKVIKWAFSAQLNEVSEVLDLDESDVIGKLSEIKLKGVLPYETVKFQVQASSTKEKKGEMLAQQFDTYSKSYHSLQEIGLRINQTPVNADSLSFSSPQVNKSLSEPALIGASFGSKINTLSKPVIGDKGVYLLNVQNRYIIPGGPGKKVLKEQALLSLKGRAENEAIESLKKLANVSDNRAKFF